MSLQTLPLTVRGWHPTFPEDVLCPCLGVSNGERLHVPALLHLGGGLFFSASLLSKLCVHNNVKRKQMAAKKTTKKPFFLRVWL